MAAVLKTVPVTRRGEAFGGGTALQHPRPAYFALFFPLFSVQAPASFLKVQEVRKPPLSPSSCPGADLLQSAATAPTSDATKPRLPMRYVLRHQSDPGSLQADQALAVAAVRRARGRVVDTAPGLLLVEGSDAMANRLRQKLPGWLLAPEVWTPRTSTAAKR